ncbi:MAG: hypothetical protein A2V63_11980 [Candidatus Eisenbacteria bacterium RBG_19FT_COMBO_70_11]|nr:MAG: hypothetical protein A2V63_11980 [Candidatus Eisenbacteria bacterium RBG_19FT_COMBO_70_11]
MPPLITGEPKDTAGLRVALTVPGFMAWEKVTTIVVVSATPVALFAGEVVTMVGAVVTVQVPVVLVAVPPRPSLTVTDIV